MIDEVRFWSDELARDPSSLVFLPLAESLRRRGQLALARKVALRGVDRHPQNPDAHDQLARIHADAGDLEDAFSEWQTVQRLAPGHVGAIKGMAFIRFQQGHLGEAERLLLDAQSVESETDDIAAAIHAVRGSGSVTPTSVATMSFPGDARQLFDDVLASGQAAIVLDGNGAVLAGAFRDTTGRDVTGEVGAALSGVSGEAHRATRHLAIGAWRSIVFETEGAVVCIAPSPSPASGEPSAGGLIMLTAPASTPLGMLRRLLDRCVARAGAWVAGGARS